MATDATLQTLCGYYLRARAAREDAMRSIREAYEGGLKPVALLEVEVRLAVYHSLVYVLLEGLRDCEVIDEPLEALIAGPNLQKLRRLRNATFFFQKGAPGDDFSTNPDSPDWIRSVWIEIDRWFTDHVVHSGAAEPALQ